MANDNLIVEEAGGLVTITMNRSEKRNALSVAMMSEMLARLREIGGRTTARVVIIAGAGPAFSAGHDLAELKGRDLSFYRREFDICAELMTAIQEIPQPVIARVHGVATAAGCQLVAACDLAVAGDSARFATPGVKIGLFCSTPMVALTRAVGRKHAMEMLLTGEMIDAYTAERWGLVNRVVPAADLIAETNKLAIKIAHASALVVGIGKRAFYAQIDLDTAGAYAHTKEVMSCNAATADAQEGITAFLEKRNPVWRGK
ncbi:MAG TPA: enoyl-CoA hydratase [Candidatus Binataceae bacterium]|nr:enoyl-CoA hydratase [Candidatus Binataceae bacterium]